MKEILDPENIEFLIQKLINFSLDFGGKIIAAILVLLIGRWIIKRLKKLTVKIMEKNNFEPSLSSFIKSLVSISLNFILIIIIIGVVGLETSSFVALFASAGVAIGLALSGTLQNFAGGVMILIFKPYKVGDFVEAQGQTGIIKEIQIFNTVIVTADNKIIIIPNGGLSTGIITNYSKESQRRVDWQFGIAYGDSYEKAKQVIATLLDNDERVLKEPAYFIALSSLGDSSVNIVVRAWVKSPDYWSVYFDMNEKVYNTFAKEGLNIPFPQMDIHVIK